MSWERETNSIGEVIHQGCSFRYVPNEDDDYLTLKNADTDTKVDIVLPKSFAAWEK